MFDKISNGIKTVLSEIEDVQIVYDFEASNLEGFPAITITPSSNESAFATSTENRRAYGFLIRIYNERGSGNSNEETSERTMRQLVDQVLDALDKRYRTLDVAAETGYEFLFMHAAPSRWAYADGAVKLRVAEVEVRVDYDIDTTLIA